MATFFFRGEHRVLGFFPPILIQQLNSKGSYMTLILQSGNIFCNSYIAHVRFVMKFWSLVREYVEICQKCNSKALLYGEDLVSDWWKT